MHTREGRVPTRKQPGPTVNAWAHESKEWGLIPRFSQGIALRKVRGHLQESVGEAIPARAMLDATCGEGGAGSFILSAPLSVSKARVPRFG